MGIQMIRATSLAVLFYFNAFFLSAAVAAEPQIAAHWHTVGLRSDGTLSAVGFDGYGQCDVSSWEDITQVSVGMYTTIGVTGTGSVMAVGDNSKGQCNVSDWEEIAQVAAGKTHTVGLKEDGTVVAAGDDTFGQCGVSGWQNIEQVAAGEHHTVALKSDGKVVAVGWQQNGQCSVSGWSGIQQVDAGYTHTVALRSDGRVEAAGNNAYGQCDVDDWKNITQVSAGGFHTLGLRSDGTVLAAGDNSEGQCDVSSWTNIKQIAAGRHHSVGLKNDNTVVAVGYNYHGECYVASWILSESKTWFYDKDGDGYGDPDVSVEDATQPDGYVADSSDCDDSDADIHPGATEIDGDGIDQNCDGDEDVSETTWYYDGDGDGYGGTDYSIEAKTQPIGYVADNTDCDDADASIHPDAAETEGDGIDQDCDGSDTAAPSTWYLDADGDGYGDPAEYMDSDAQPTGYVADNTDCDDSDADINPGMDEIEGDGIDQDCDGEDKPVNKTWYYDADGDGYGDPDTWIQSQNQPQSYLADNTDCDDTDASIHPNAVDIISDGIDQDCDGSDAQAAAGSITIYSDLSFTLPHVVYSSILGDITLWAKFTYYFGSQNGDLLWKLSDYGVVTTSAADKITLGSDLSFTIPNAVMYMAGSGNVTLEAEFTYDGDQNGSLFWKLDSYTLQ